MCVTFEVVNTAIHQFAIYAPDIIKLCRIVPTAEQASTSKYTSAIYSHHTHIHTTCWSSAAPETLRPSPSSSPPPPPGHLNTHPPQPYEPTVSTE